MNIVSKHFTKEQYKALYEAQQLGVRFDCYLLAPGHSVWKADLPLVDDNGLPDRYLSAHCIRGLPKHNIGEQ